MSVAREVVPMMTSRRRGADTADGPQRPGRVLLVEDEHDVAELIRYNLAKEGYDVVLATNGTGPGSRAPGASRPTRRRRRPV